MPPEYFIDQMDVADILSDDGNLLPIKQWPKCWRTTLSGIEISEKMSNQGVLQEVIKKIKWPDKLKNLQLMGRHVNIQAYNVTKTPANKMDQQA